MEFYTVKMAASEQITKLFQEHYLHSCSNPTAKENISENNFS